MRDLHLIQLNEHMDLLMDKYQHIEVYKKFERGDLEVTLYKLSKDSTFFISNTHKVEGIKTYTLLSGKCINLETKQILLPGDLLIVDHEQNVLHMDVLEDSLVMIHALNESVFAGWEATVEGIKHILSDIQTKDSYTEQHCNNVFTYVSRLAIKCGLTSNALYCLNKAARFHDVGKIFIDDSILNNPGSLTEEEFKSMKGHVELGKELVCRYFTSDIYDIIEQHHERLDGSGYPKGIRTEEISLAGRILAVCDSFDAMTTDRVYKAGKSKLEAIEELRALGGSKLDAWVIECLVEVLEEMEELN